MYGQKRSTEWTSAADGQLIAYGIPEGFDASVFVGKEVESVLFSVNTVSICMSENVGLTIYAALQFESASDERRPAVERLPLSESGLVQLPGHRVTHAAIDESATLSLTFDNGCVLNVFDDFPCYDSYCIDYGRHQIIV